MKKYSFVFLFQMIFLLFALIITEANAAYFATAIGSEEGRFSTRGHINDAADSYDQCGYSNTRRIINPSQMVLTSNLSADVQFYAGHATYDNIILGDTGIRLGEFRVNFKNWVFVDEVGTWYDTTLVTYAGCSTAGENNVYRQDSLTGVTAEKGAKVVVGFRNMVDEECMLYWARRYNNRLASGYGVYDAVTYANTFIYTCGNSIKNVHIVHHGNINQKIGIYDLQVKNVQNNTYASEDIGERKKINFKFDNNDNITRNNIEEILKDNISEFDKKEYNIDESFIGDLNVDTNEYNETKYYDVTLKIGDFKTNSGYIVEVKNNKIQNIYDNVINKEKEEKALENIQNFKLSNILSKEKESEIKNNAKNKVNASRKINTFLIDEPVDVEYFYDIEANKKYMKVLVKTEKRLNDYVGYAYETVNYEI